MTASIDFSKANPRNLQFIFSQKVINKPKVVPKPIVKEVVVEKPKVHVVTKTESLEIKKLKAVYLALKKSGRYDQAALLKIEKRLKDLS
jgi:hypothetical protein